MAKRYVLYQADSDLGEGDLDELARILGNRHRNTKVIAISGNSRAIIVRATTEVAAEIRDRSATIEVAGKRLSTVLTSGAIGNLKRRAKESGALGNDEIPE